MPDYAVSTAFLGKDRVSHLFDKMGRSADRFGRDGKRAFRGVRQEADHASTAMRNATKHGYKFGAIVKGILVANAIRGGIGLVGTAIRTAGEEFVDFDDTMVRAAIKFDDIGVSAKDAANGYKFLRAETALLKKETLGLIKGTPFSPVDAAKAVDSLAASGYLRKGGAMAGLKASMAVATATGEDLPAVTSNLSGMMGSFGLRSKDGAKEAANFKHLGDVMTLAANISNVSIMDLKETMEQVGPVSGIMGTNLEEAAAMASILGNASIKGTQGATALKNIMLALANPLKAAEISANIGGLVDASGKMKNVSVIVTETYKKLKQVMKGPDAKLKIAGVMNDLFGLRGIAGAKTLADSIDEIITNTEKLKKSGGTAEMMADAAAALSMKIKLAELKNALLTKTFAVLESFNTGSQKGIEGFIAKIEKWDMTGVINMLRTTGNVLKVMWSIIEPMAPAIPYLTFAWIGLNGALTVFKGIQAATLLWNIGAALTAGLGPMGAMTTAFGALGGAIAKAMAPLMLAAPVLTTVLGILGAASYTASVARENWGDDRTADQLIEESKKPKAPNYDDAEARAKRASFFGQLNIAGAPPGSTVTGKSGGGASFNMHLLGVNP